MLCGGVLAGWNAIYCVFLVWPHPHVCVCVKEVLVQTVWDEGFGMRL